MKVVLTEFVTLDGVAPQGEYEGVTAFDEP